MRIRSLVLAAFGVSGLVTMLLAWWGMEAMLVDRNSFSLVIGITFAANISGAIIGYLLLKPTVHSLQQLNHQVNQIAAQNFQAVETIQSPQELHSLAQNFNTMVQALEQAFHDLSTSEAEKTQLVAHLGHDLKTPLSVLQSQIEALQDGLIEVEEYPDLYQHMLQQIERMSHLTNQLMEVALIERREQTVDTTSVAPPQWASLNLDQFLVNLLTPFQVQLLKHQQTLSVAVADDLRPIVSDEAKLQRILANILHNASQYSAEKTTIRFYCGQTAEATYFKICDEGIGIAPSELPHIFERLYRVESSRNQATGGAGLGLYISRGLAQELGGTLNVTSQLGKGSCFTLTLPQSKNIK